MNRSSQIFTLSAFFAALLVTATKADEPRYKAVATVTIAGKPYSLPRVSSRSGQAAEVSYPVTDETSKKAQDAVIQSKATFVNKVMNYEVTASIPTAAGTVTKVSCSGSGDSKEPIVYTFVSGGKPYGFTVVFSPLAANEAL